MRSENNLRQARILEEIHRLNPRSKLNKACLSYVLSGRVRFTAKDAKAYRKAVGKMERRKEVYVTIRGIRHALSEFE